MDIINDLPAVASEKSKELVTRIPEPRRHKAPGVRLTGVAAPGGHLGKARRSFRANGGLSPWGKVFREQVTPGSMDELIQRPRRVRKHRGGAGPGRLNRRRAPSGPGASGRGPRAEPGRGGSEGAGGNY